MYGIRNRMMGFGGDGGSGDDAEYDEYMRSRLKQRGQMAPYQDNAPDVEQTSATRPRVVEDEPVTENVSMIDQIKKRLLEGKKMDIPADSGSSDNGEFEAGKSAGSLIKMLLGGI